MSPLVLLVARGDAALESAGWVAEQVVQRLREAGYDVALREGASGLRAEVAALGDAAGVAIFSHGDERSLAHGPGDGERILDPHNLAALSGRWAHAWACRAGVELAGLAVAAGCTCFAGYEAALIKEWFPAEIPDEVREDFQRLVSETTLALAEGERDGDALRRRLLALAAPLERWCDQNPRRAAGLSITVQQLYRRLVLRVPAPSVDC